MRAAADHALIWPADVHILNSPMLLQTVAYDFCSQSVFQVKLSLSQ